MKKTDTHIKLTPSEKERGRRHQEARKFANEVIQMCQQRNFTVDQFNVMAEAIDFKRQLLNQSAADKTLMQEINLNP